MDLESLSDTKKTIRFVILYVCCSADIKDKLVV